MDTQQGKRVRRTRRRTEGENIHRFLRATPKKYRFGKRQPMIAYMNSGSKNSPPSMIN